MNDSPTTYRVRKIYRDGGRLLNDGAVVCRGGRIEAIGPWSEMGGIGREAEIHDLGDVLLLPGLVNAHTHLRLTYLKSRIAPTTDFVGWLGRIAMSNKFARTSTLRDSLRSGADELLKNGVTTAVDIDLDGLSAETLDGSPLRLVFAHECINLKPSRTEKAVRRLFEEVVRRSPVPFRREHGVAPHAPFSVCREMWELLARRLRASPRFLTIHVAESKKEVEMIAEGRGSLVRALRGLGALPFRWKPPGCSPVDFLERTGILDTPGVAAHCGTVDDRDAMTLARRKWTVAFCPGTHEYFGRRPWPLDRFRRAGVPVCLATDSAASNTGLSLMEEMRRAARMFPDLTATEIVAAATTVPARAIGWGDAIGRIEPGFLADLSAWSPAPRGDTLDRGWFESDPPTCTATIIGGRRVQT